MKKPSNKRSKPHKFVEESFDDYKNKKNLKRSLTKAINDWKARRVATKL